MRQRQDKLEDLREVIRRSHTEVTSGRQTMTSEEERCKSLGLEVYGMEYIPPVEGADKIRHISSHPSFSSNCLPMISVVEPVQSRPAPASWNIFKTHLIENIVLKNKVKIVYFFLVF